MDERTAKAGIIQNIDVILCNIQNNQPPPTHILTHTEK